MRSIAGTAVYVALLVTGAGAVVLGVLRIPGTTDFDSVLRGAAALSGCLGVVFAHRNQGEQLDDFRRYPLGNLFDEGWLVALMSGVFTVYTFVFGFIIVGGALALLKVLGDALG